MNLPAPIAPEVRVAHGQALTTSLNIAQVFAKRHTEVLRSIRDIDCSEEFRQRNFASANYLDAQGKFRPMYDITRDGFTFLAMGFTGKEAARFKEAYITAFNRMEAELSALRQGVELPLANPDALPRETLREVLRAAVDRLSENDWLEAGYKAPPEVADETFYLKQKVAMWSVEARKSWDENRRLEELVDLYKFKADTLAAKLQPEPKRKAYSPAEEAEVWRRHLANEGPSAIAKALGRSVNSIENLIRRLRRQGGPK